MRARLLAGILRKTDGNRCNHNQLLQISQKFMRMNSVALLAVNETGTLSEQNR